MRQRAANYLLLLLFLSLIGIAPSSFAQDTAKEKEKSKGKKTTTLDFEDELVEGEFKKPELFYLLQRKQFNYKRLIKLRKDFIPEMKQTSQQVDSTGGSK